ncbi:hypothetical protein [Zhongshania sp.]|uniref:hypothetical protein n=1 Tax=Zhongshania sp. TaxID=1971902 RepID=UPI003569EC2F
MGLLAKLFGSDKVIEGGINAADKLFLTAEERMDYKAKFLSLYEPFKLAQRYLALIVSIPYVLAWLITFLVSFSADKNVELQLELLDGKIGTAFIVIVGFYFAGGMAESIFKGKK